MTSLAGRRIKTLTNSPVFFGNDVVYFSPDDSTNLPGVAIFSGANPTQMYFQQNGSNLIISKHYSRTESFFPYYDSVNLLSWFQNSPPPVGYFREIKMFYTIGDQSGKGFSNLFTGEVNAATLSKLMPQQIPWSESLSSEDVAQFYKTHNLYSYWYCLNPSPENCNTNIQARQEQDEQESEEVSRAVEVDVENSLNQEVLAEVPELSVDSEEPALEELRLELAEQGESQV